jgi:hypothetical protein
MTQMESISFARPINTPDWGGQKARTYVTDAEAAIVVDLDGRIATITPNGKGTRLIIPLENVTQWKPQQQPQPSPAPSPKRSRSTASSAT